MSVRAVAEELAAFSVEELGLLAWFETDRSVSTRQLDDEGLAGRLGLLVRELRRLEVEIAEVLHVGEQRRVFADAGHRSMKGWARISTSWSGAETVVRLRVGRFFGAHPTVAEMMAAGEVGVAQIELLAAAFANPRCGVRLTAALPVLLEHAQRLSFEDFRELVRRWEMLADEDGAHRCHERSHANRRAAARTDGTGFRLEADGGTGQGAEMLEIFGKYCDAEFATDWDQVVAEHGDAATPSLMVRTARQRAFDALHRIFVDAASRPAGSTEPAMVVNLVVDLHTYERLLADVMGGTGPTSTRPDDPRWWRKETASGTLVADEVVIDAMIRGHVRRIVIDAAGVVVDVGRKQRVFTGAMRDAIVIMGGSCAFRGCDRPRHQCQVDHTVDRQHGGPTATTNAGLLCGFHNRIKNRGYSLWRDPNGYWHTYRPDGTEIV